MNVALLAAELVASAMAARVAPEYSEPAASFEPLAQHLGGQPNLA
eukprot:COSAG04_NODE_23408_length_339_cov_0.641667_1_plen_44_part_10